MRLVLNCRNIHFPVGKISIMLQQLSHDTLFTVSYKNHDIIILQCSYFLNDERLWATDVLKFTNSQYINVSYPDKKL